MKSSLKNFNPDVVGNLEARMWKAYYRHQFLSLFFLLVQLMYHTFGLNYFYSTISAYKVVTAAKYFRLQSGREDKSRILERLESFYKYIRQHSVEEFDYERVAFLEMEWWFVDRYPDKHKISRRDAIAKAASALYRVDENELIEYADLRARAMELQDVAESEDKEADWTEIEEILKQAFSSLKTSVN